MGLRAPHSEAFTVAESTMLWTTTLETRSDRCMATVSEANRCTKVSEATQSDTTLMRLHGVNRVAACFRALIAPNQIQLIIQHRTLPHTTPILPGCPILAPPRTTPISRLLREQVTLQDPNRQLCHQVALWTRLIQRCPVSQDFNFLSEPISKTASWFTS